MKILVIGGGGREHAIVRALARSPHALELICAPGNAGIAAEAECVASVGGDDLDAAVDLATDRGVDLVVPGPEAPLVAGLVDRMQEAGIPAFGPSREAARLEGSKLFAKEVMSAAGVPTASHVVLTSREQALAELSRAGLPCVLKADGLASGKGVMVCTTESAAEEAVEALFTERRFGDTSVVLEEHLEGEELSLLALCDGENVLPLAPARDFKRIFDGDRGPNTGGMGSFSPVPGVEEAEAERIADSVHRPVVEELRRRGAPFHGVLYAGLMMTAEGPRVLEFNVRFGDPETQAVLPRLTSDLAGLCLAASRPGGLSGMRAEFDPRWAVTLVMASRGYPESSSKGDRITGLEEAAGIAEVLHAGTARSEDGRGLVTAGGRVLNVTALGADAGEARRRAYDAAGRISFDGAQIRSDIAAFATAGA